MTNHDLLAAWEAAVREEAACRERLAPGCENDLVRQWWRSLETIFRLSYQSPARALPGEVAIIMERLASSLAAGAIPDPVRDAQAEGRRKPFGREKQDREIAVAYRLAARTEGYAYRTGEVVRVDDPSPVKTLSDWFGAKKATIQSWVRNESPFDFKLESVTSEILTKLAQEAGARARLAGRTHAAIESRGTKRG